MSQYVYVNGKGGVSPDSRFHNTEMCFIDCFQFKISMRYRANKFCPLWILPLFPSLRLNSLTKMVQFIFVQDAFRIHGQSTVTRKRYNSKSIRANVAPTRTKHVRGRGSKTIAQFLPNITCTTFNIPHSLQKYSHVLCIHFILGYSEYPAYTSMHSK